MKLDELKLLIQDPVIKQTVVDIIITALDEREKKRAMESVQSFLDKQEFGDAKDFPRPTSGREIK